MWVVMSMMMTRLSEAFSDGLVKVLGQARWDCGAFVANPAGPTPARSVPSGHSAPPIPSNRRTLYPNHHPSAPITVAATPPA